MTFVILASFAAGALIGYLIGHSNGYADAQQACLDSVGEIVAKRLKRKENTPA